ncbi:MAG TPA: hypothetical protein PKY30_22730, partial [Myxococcota bacterium]|nr:hypothetical protein [Myxococcota bacterium]
EAQIEAIVEAKLADYATKSELQAAVDGVEGEQGTQDARLTAAETTLAALDGRVDSCEQDNSRQDGELTALQSSDNQQNLDIDDLDQITDEHSIDITTLTATTSQHSTDIATLLATTSQHSSDIAALQASDTSQNSRLNNHDTDIVNLQQDLQSLRSSSLRRISADETWTIAGNGSGDYSDLADAIQALDGVWIDPGVTVTLSVSAGVYNHSQPLHMAHPNGDQVQIVGDPANPGTVVLSFANCNGLEVEGSSLGYFGGITVEGTDTVNTYGVYASENASIELGPLVVMDFDTGIVSTTRSTIVEATQNTNAGWISSSSNTHAGIGAWYSGLVRLNYIDASDNDEYGIHADGQSWVQADYSTADRNGIMGVASDYGSVVFAGGGSANDNGVVGYESRYGSVLQVNY